MKVAFLLSGAPRFEHKALFKLVDAIKGFDQADFFIRTYKTDDFGNTSEEFVNYLKSNGIDDRCSFPVVDMIDDNASNLPIFPSKYPISVAGWAPNFLIMWWGALKCYELYDKYVSETGTKYDLVFRMRTDTIPNGDIDLTKYHDPGKMYNAYNFGDYFLFGSPEMYKKFIGYWGYIEVFGENREFINPEESLRTYFERTGIKYECMDVWVQPVRGQKEYKVRPEW